MIARVLLLLLCSLAMPDAAFARVPRDEVAPERRILVMLRLPPPHFRAGAGYGGGYGEDQSRGGRTRIAARIAHRHQLLLEGNWPMPVIGIDCFIMVVPVGRSRDAVLADISRDSGVSWAQPVSLFQTLGATDPDPLFPAQPTAKAWRLADLHRVATGRRVKVAVIDSKVDERHPDLTGQIALSRNFVVNRPAKTAEDHGTGVAGIIAAKVANGVGIAGVAPDARLYALRACWQVGPAPTLCDSLSLAKAIAFAVEHRADVINLSLGGPGDPLLSTLLRAAMARRIAVVAAVDRNHVKGGFPASLDGVIAVASAPLTFHGKAYLAPGRDIPTAQPGGSWSLVSGASYAAAEVSGLLALLREKRGSGIGAQSLIVARGAHGEIDACASLLGRSLACGGAGGVATAGLETR